MRRAVFAYAAADYSLREVAALLTHEQPWISEQGVHSRLTNCVGWLEALLVRLLFNKATRGAAVPCRRLKLVDAPTLNCPAARGTDYRLQLCYEAINQSSCGVKRPEVTGAERLTPFASEASEIVLGDRIYGKAKHRLKVKE